MRTRFIIPAALAAAALAGCGTTSTDPAGGSSAASSEPAATTSPTSPDPSTSPSPPDPKGTPTVPPPADSSVPPDLQDRPEVQAAMKDAAGRAGIVPGEVVLAGYMPVTWNDGSLGCPQKGMSYTQMTVEGELLLLRVDQRTMQYHARLGGPFRFCADPSGGYGLRTAS